MTGFYPRPRRERRYTLTGGILFFLPLVLAMWAVLLGLVWIFV